MNPFQLKQRQINRERIREITLKNITCWNRNKNYKHVLAFRRVFVYSLNQFGQSIRRLQVTHITKLINSL